MQVNNCNLATLSEDNNIFPLSLFSFTNDNNGYIVALKIIILIKELAHSTAVKRIVRTVNYNA